MEQVEAEDVLTDNDIQSLSYEIADLLEIARQTPDLKPYALAAKIRAILRRHRDGLD